MKLDFTKGVSAPSLNINVNGGLANQDVTALFGSITNTDLQLAARLGNGLEHFTADFNGALAGNANVGVNVQGGTLSDSINVQANAAIAATAKLSVDDDGGRRIGHRPRRLRGQAGGRFVDPGEGRRRLGLAGGRHQPCLGQHRLAVRP